MILNSSHYKYTLYINNQLIDSEVYTSEIFFNISRAIADSMTKYIKIIFYNCIISNFFERILAIQKLFVVRCNKTESLNYV